MRFNQIESSLVRSFVRVLTGVEEQSVRLARAKVQRDGVLTADDRFAARLAQVVREELAAAEGGLGRRFVCVFWGAAKSVNW